MINVNMKLFNIYFLSALLSVFFIDSGWAQVYELSLDDAVSLATGNSPEARERKMSFQAAEWRFKAARAGLFPQISAGGNIPGYSRQITSVSQPDGTILYVPVSQALSNASITVQQSITPTGGTLFLSTGLGRIDLFNSNSAFWQAQPFIVGISQPLGRANFAKWNWRREKLNYSVAEKQLLETREDLASKSADAWFDVYVALLQLNNARSNVRINDTLYLISKGRYDLGKIAETELLQVELSLLNAQANVVQAETNLARSTENLKIITGLDLSTRLSLPEPPEPSVMVVDSAFALELARTNRSEYANLELLKLNALATKRDASYSRFISGDLNANFGFNQTGNTIDQAYKNPLNSQVFSIGFSIPIYGANRSQYVWREARDRYESALAQNERRLLELALEVKSAVMNLKQLEQSVVVAKRAFEVSDKRFELSKNRFLIGKIDITNLTIAQNEKDLALISYANTLRNYHLARYRIRRLTLYDFEKAAPIRY